MLALFYNQKNSIEINAPASDDATTIAISQAVTQILQQDEARQEEVKYYQMPELPLEDTVISEPEVLLSSYQESEVYQMPQPPLETEVADSVFYDPQDSSLPVSYPMPEIPVETISIEDESHGTNFHSAASEVYEMPEQPEPELPIEFDFDDSVRN